jgi:hypothetical protein
VKGTIGENENPRFTHGGEFLPRLCVLVAGVLRLRERIVLLEEPDALIALVRVCGGLGGRPPGLPGDQFNHGSSRMYTDPNRSVLIRDGMWFSKTEKTN